MSERLFADIVIGEKASFTKTISEYDVYAFAGISGDFNPVHVDKTFASQTLFKQRIAHGMLSVALISTVLGTKLPGINTIYLQQEVKFTAPVFFGDTITAEVEVLEKDEDRKIIVLRTTVTNQDGKKVADGQAKVMKK